MALFALLLTLQAQPPMLLVVAKHEMPMEQCRKAIESFDRDYNHPPELKAICLEKK